MNKISSTFLPIAISILLITTCLCYFSFIRKFNSLSIGFYVFLATSSIFLIFSIVNFIMHRKGIPIKYESKDLSIDFEKQAAIFIHIPENELYKIAPNYNITYLFQHADHQLMNYPVHIAQTRGLSPSIGPYSLKNTTQIQLLLSQEDVNNIKDATGICIVTKSDTKLQELKNILLNNIFIYYSHNHKKNLILHCSHIKIDSNDPEELGNTQHLYSAKDFYIAIQDKAIPIEGFNNSEECTVYDHVVSNILNTFTTEYHYDNSWFETEAGKIAISFFRMFSPQNILDHNMYFKSAITGDLKFKVRRVQEYIHNIAREQYTHEFDERIFNLIKEIYNKTSYNTTQYSHLHNNRYINTFGNNISDFIRWNINNEPLYKYICSIAVQNHGDNDLDKQTNQFIKDILNEENIQINIQPIISLIENPNILITRNMYIKDKDLHKTIHELLSTQQQVSCHELIKLARKYIMDSCLPHMQFYSITQHTINLNPEHITVFTPEYIRIHNTSFDTNSLEDFSSTRMLLTH
ncbi:hypothetical protein [Ehrlichia ruminantium]|uniref:hypothetical protein n=1 Tax=Ehrlichia ruminantium TaxID=779 RepID=UPI00080BFC17|nr:hypothetical protein [Ehrlichia ruminantium]QLK52209.1 hypothetical protein FDZ65_01570 [Ehrlichia ruminantium]QLK54040.1 hypothetical protein FDZ63_01565 [Ehrlichia ruminantium]QLK56789.1 hypothetical protein FDZ60_01565 [Ehrlichia ruminantium]